jgi:tRNA(Ile)-lysidine synthase
VPGPARVRRERDVLVRRAGRAATPAPFTVPIAPGGTVEHPAGVWRLVLSVPRPRRAGEDRPSDADHALFDADRLAAALVVRSPATGDRIRLLAGGTRKLQDVLVDAKIPREARSETPVLVAGGDILWVAGLARGRGAALGPATARIVEGVVVRRTKDA